MSGDIFRNGMNWFRADFHLHTKADKEFKYIGEPSEFNGLFVDRLVAEGVSIGVITNHNKFDREEYKALRKVAGRKDVWLLPGVELSVNDGANGIHCLIVFDKNTWLATDDDFINQFLTSVFEGIPNRENENTSCNCNLETILGKLDSHRKQGRDSFLVLAHVNQAKGFFQEIDGGRIELLANKDIFRQNVLGVQKLTDRDTEHKCKTWLHGWMPAKLQGSDCKSIDMVGKAQIVGGTELKTFIKIGDFNFEALKYALLDKDYRVANTISSISKSYLKSITFSGGKLDGKKISLSPDLNNFIGIRGSGKSSIIEILRYTLGIDLNKAAADVSYKNELVTYILGSGGKVILEFHGVDNKDYRIERILGQVPSLYSIDGKLMDCSLNVVLNMPMYFGQKDLSNKKDSFESELIERMIGSHFEEQRQYTKDKVQQVKSCLIELQKVNTVTEQMPELERIIKDARQKLQIFKENGVEEKLKLQTQYENDINKLEQRINKVIELKTFLVDKLANTDIWEPLAGCEDNNEIFSFINLTLKEGLDIAQSISKEIDRLNIIIDKLNEYLNQLNDKVESMKEDFAKIKRELNSDTVNPDDFLKINRILTDSLQKLEDLRLIEEKKKERKLQLMKALDNLNEAWRTEFLALEKNVGRISDTSKNLDILVEFKGNKKDFLSHFKNLVRGTGMRDSVCQNIVEQFKDYIEIYKEWDKFKNMISESIRSEVLRKVNDKIEDLLTYKVENKVSIKYKGKDLSRHSLGQRASALILFLLAQQETDILIIDQPEDDLDNQTIYDEVIKEIVNLKDSMQFVFATHNANIPVLGESEKVVACNFEDSSKIEIIEGSIDTPVIQKSIVSIMEGGKEAFTRRKDIYNIWNIK